MSWEALFRTSTDSLDGVFERYFQHAPADGREIVVW